MTLRTNPSAFAFAACLACGSPAATPVATTDPCAGSRFDAAALPRECIAHGAIDRAPLPKDGLRTQVIGPLTVPSGDSGAIVVELVNVSPRAISIDVSNDCNVLDPEIVGRPDDACNQGFCDHPEGDTIWRIRLAPAGTLRAKIGVVARLTRGAPSDHGTVTCGDATPLAPGRYPLRLALPWQRDRLETTLDVVAPR